MITEPDRPTKLLTKPALPRARDARETALWDDRLQLYSWMISQTSAVYFQAYKLAYDLAKRAERAYQQDLGVEDSQFVQFGAWDIPSLAAKRWARTHAELDLGSLTPLHEAIPELRAVKP